MLDRLAGRCWSAASWAFWRPCLPGTADGLPGAPTGRLLIREDGSAQAEGPLDPALRAQILEAARQMLRALYPRAETRRFTARGPSR